LKVPKRDLKFQNGPKKTLEDIKNSPWADCPHDFTVKIAHLMKFCDEVLENWAQNVSVGSLSQGEQRLLFDRAGRLHQMLVLIGRATRPGDNPPPPD